MESDYPAAHSMDTTWFAVDREGNVGIFSSGEAGAVPLDALSEEADLFAEVDKRLASGAWKYDPAQGLAADGLGGQQHCPAAYLQEPLKDILMFLPALDAVADDLRRGHAGEVPATEGSAVVWSRLTRSRFQQLHDEGACTHCRRLWLGTEDEEEAARTRGSLFHFEHLSDNWISGPYALETRPVRPLKLEELPPAVQRTLAQVRFHELSFQETPVIQPVEHFECEAWDCAWLPVDGSEARPIPGKEAEYENVYIAWLRSPDDEENDVQMAPPPGWTAEKEARALAADPEAPAAPPPGAPRPGGGLLGIIRRFFGG